MKILSFKLGGHVSFGPKVKKKKRYGTYSLFKMNFKFSFFSSSIVDGIALGFDFVEQIRKLVEAAEKSGNASSFKREFTEIEWLSPIPRTPKNIMCIGKTMMNMRRKWVQKQHQRI